MTVIAPIVALFITVTVQMAAMFHEAVQNISNAETKASRAVLDWEEQNVASGLKRPCIELITPGTFREDGGEIAIGLGLMKRMIVLPQEVTVASEAICIDR